MSILTAPQIAAAAAAFANSAFVAPNLTANLSMTQIIAGITAIDNLMAGTVAAFATAGSGAANAASVFGVVVAAAVPASTSQQQGGMLIFWLQQLPQVG
jgi:hypothetical protein